MSRVFSESARQILIESKDTARRLGNNYVGIYHFLMCLNRFNSDGKLNVKVTLGEKKVMIHYLKGRKMDLNGKREYVLTKQLQEACQVSRFHSWIMGSKQIHPEHIYLGILGYEVENKERYLQLLTESGVLLTRLKRMMIRWYFTRNVKRLVINFIFNL